MKLYVTGLAITAEVAVRVAMGRASEDIVSSAAMVKRAASFDIFVVTMETTGGF